MVANSIISLQIISGTIVESGNGKKSEDIEAIIDRDSDNGLVSRELVREFKRIEPITIKIIKKIINKMRREIIEDKSGKREDD